LDTTCSLGSFLGASRVDSFAAVVATFWPNKEMGRDQDGLGGYTCNILLDRPCAWIWAKLPVYLYIMIGYVSV
jgi:hypothetical protein